MSEKKNISVSPMTFPWQTKDPFLFCAHHEDFYPEGDANMAVPEAALKGRHIGNDFTIKDGFRMYHGSSVPGFPSHPHRGFETVTIARKGFVDHSDSLGAAGRFGQGDVQWMTAGKGVQHSEMFPLIHEEKENHLEIFQIWLNLPKDKKFVEPHFSMLWAESIPQVDIQDSEGRHTSVKLIAGELNGQKAPAPAPDSWAADVNNGVAIWNIKMDVGSEWTLPESVPGLSRSLYFFKGNGAVVNGENVSNYHSVEVISNAVTVIKNGSEESEILLLQGRPLNEPVVQYGPFVMNTEQQIRETYMEYQRTQFGGWPWPKHDNTHERAAGRFALYANGKEEKPL